MIENWPDHFGRVTTIWIMLEVESLNVNKKQFDNMVLARQGLRTTFS